MTKHHGHRDFQSKQERLAASKELMGQCGPRGEFPDGELPDNDPKDSGEIDVLVGIRQGLVRLEFGVPLVWMAMEPEEARELGETLIYHASRFQQEGNPSQEEE